MAAGHRYRWLRRITSLDPVKDHQEIYRISAGHEFPWDYTRALELALFRTFCVPRISGLLDATGEFQVRPQRRYDDTALLMAEIAAHGYDSPRGREALRVINRLHGRYAIDNDDMRYVLSTFVFEPIDWIDRYGWRPLSDHERLASLHFYRAVGARMAIRDVPADLGGFRRFKDAYEARNFRYHETNRRVGEKTLGLFAGWFPQPVRPVARTMVLSLLDRPMLTAFGFPEPPPWVRNATRTALRARAMLVRLMPPRRRSRLAVMPRNRSYPGYPTGYRPADLGAPEPPSDLHPRWRRRPP